MVVELSSAENCHKSQNIFFADTFHSMFDSAENEWMKKKTMIYFLPSKWQAIMNSEREIIYQ